MKMQYQKYRKMQFCIQLNIDIWEIILYLQANPYRLKTKNINSLISLCFIALGFLRKKRKELVVY